MIDDDDDDIPSFASAQKENEDFYYAPGGWMVMTAKFHQKRGYCCGSGCRHCPYFPAHSRGNTTLG